MDLQDDMQGHVVNTDKIVIDPDANTGPRKWATLSVDGITVAQGWECPRCKLINAPHVNSCSCQVSV